ncbi:Uncharacterised protein [BD1-7 clade bacterium]|uniref:Uncharacterized protein n=1 Tax=BD1-7 clade bacterium TaxID=2029982 RepID=A0A5S9QZR8_9GAMM|nr:Uncharacterised protein [BD1-7 clade bacterium]
MLLSAVSLITNTQALETRWIKEKPWHKQPVLTDTSKLGWLSGNYANKLATAADWLRRSPVAVAAVHDEGSVDALKPYAERLVFCVDQSAESMHFTYEMTDVATTCMAVFGWLPTGEEQPEDRAE